MSEQKPKSKRQRDREAREERYRQFTEAIFGPVTRKQLLDAIDGVIVDVHSGTSPREAAERAVKRMEGET